MTRKFIGISGAILMVMAFTATADAAIVVGQGADGIDLGASKTSVLESHGKPFRTQGSTLFYGKPCLCVIVFGNTGARSIDILSKAQHTDKGIGVGSSYEATVAAYPEANCYHPPVYGETSRYCVIKSRFKGRLAKTVFAFFDKDLGVRDVEVRLG
jgi:hypothetical protein